MLVLSLKLFILTVRELLLLPTLISPVGLLISVDGTTSLLIARVSTRGIVPGFLLHPPPNPII